LRDGLTDPVRNRMVDEIESIARDLGCGLAPLAIAWCLKNRNVSSTILGATRPAQLAENLKALEVLPKLTTEAMQRIDAIVGSGYD
jgi:aryl-alcohol dehydrogenase-like predicted oxidoreductase